MIRYFASGLLLSICISGVYATDVPPYPSDVEEFIDRREMCDHFRGEYPYDEERAEFLRLRINETCTGTDAELRALKDKYKDDVDVMKLLNQFEDRIEARIETENQPES